MPQSTDGSKCSKPLPSSACWTDADGRRIRSRAPARSDWFAIRTTDRRPVESMKRTSPRSRTTVEASPLIASRNSASNVSAVERVSSPMARTVSTSPACSIRIVSGPSWRVLSQWSITCSNPGTPSPTRPLLEGGRIAPQGSRKSAVSCENRGGSRSRGRVFRGPPSGNPRAHLGNPRRASRCRAPVLPTPTVGLAYGWLIVMADLNVPSRPSSARASALRGRGSRPGAGPSP
jgi:hypothetical protein